MGKKLEQVLLQLKEQFGEAGMETLNVRVPSAAMWDQLTVPEPAYETSLPIWRHLKPQQGVTTIKLLVTEEDEYIKKQLAGATRSQGEQFFIVDAYEGIKTHRGRFFRGSGAFDPETNKFSFIKPCWLEGDGVYLFDNLAPLVADSELLIEFIKWFDFIKFEATLSDARQDNYRIKDEISIVMVCSKAQFKLLIEAIKTFNCGDILFTETSTKKHI